MKQTIEERDYVKSFDSSSFKDIHIFFISYCFVIVNVLIVYKQTPEEHVLERNQ